MNAIITVVGKDKVGIICGVTNVLSSLNVNILDISQTIMQDMFTMIMLVDMGGKKVSEMSEKLDALAKEVGLSIHIQSEELFSSMHRI